MSFPQTAVQTRPPPGWVPPFAGAAPPVPPGVNPQTWGAGAWQFNPAYLYPQAGQPPPQNNAGWAAGYGWYGQPGSHQVPSYNPYKRVPRAPSAEYMSSSLSDNPLGLSNMIRREELTSEDGTPQTPWIWNPPGLVGTDADQGMITASFMDEHGHRIAQEVRGPAPSRQSSRDRADPPPPLPLPPNAFPPAMHRSPTPSRRSSYDRANGSSIYANMPPYPEPSPSRQGSHERPNDFSPSHHSAVRAPSRQNSQDRINDPPSVQSTSSRSILPALDRPLDRPKDPSSIYQKRFNSPGIPDRSPGQSPSRAGHAPEKHRQISPRREKTEDESFTAKIDLQPTFSPNIVRTPVHYNPPSRRGSSHDDESNRSSSSSHSSSSSNPIIAQLTSRMDHLSTSSAGQLVRQSSLPTYSYAPPPPPASNGSDHVDEPLSPLIYGSTLKSGSRPVLRGFSVPDIRGTPLNTIPEAASSSASTASTPAPGPFLHSRSLQASPASSSSGGRPTPPPGSSGLSNPLPRAPAESVHVPHSVIPPLAPVVPTTAVTTTRAPTTTTTTPPSLGGSVPVPERVRVGFWNRRGDHLTRTMHIVYAPMDKAYPKELEGYPENGYRDHLGLELPHGPKRPELLESLPRHGRPPVAPYDSFVVYDYRR